MLRSYNRSSDTDFSPSSYFRRYIPCENRTIGVLPSTIWVPSTWGNSPARCPRDDTDQRLFSAIFRDTKQEATDYSQHLTVRLSSYEKSEQNKVATFFDICLEIEPPPPHPFQIWKPLILSHF